MNELTAKIREFEKRLPLERMLEDYGLQPTDKGSYYLITCPMCKKREAFIYKPEYSGRLWLKCNRLNKCGYEQGLIDFIADQENLSLIDALRLLSERYGVEIELDGKYIREATKRDALKLLEGWFKRLLWEKEGREVLQYLREVRGYDDDVITRAGFGYYPGSGEVIEFLKGSGFDEDIVREVAFNIQIFDNTHPLIFPFWGVYGELEGFIARAIRGIEGKIKYLVSRGTHRGKVFYGLHWWRPGSPLIVVEGYIDALVGKVMGVEGIVAVGGNQITDNQVKTAVERGYRQFILALDSDVPLDVMRRNIDRFLKPGVKVYVIDDLKGYKDPDELIRGEGVEVFLDAVNNSLGLGKYYAKQLLRYDFNKDLERDKALREIAGIKDTLSLFEYHTLIDRVSDGWGIDKEDLLRELEEHLDIEKKREIIRQIESLKSELPTERKVDFTDKEQVTNAIEQAEEAIKGTLTRIQLIDAPGQRVWTAEDFIREVVEAPEGLKAGIDVLDKEMGVVIPSGAITVVAGRTSHGKTTLLLNLLANFINNYPEKLFILFSFEEPKRDLMLRLLPLLEPDLIDHHVQGGNLLEAMKQEIKENDKFRKLVFEKVNSYIEDGRLLIYDESFTPEQIAGLVRKLHIDTREMVGGVIIDYIQRIKIGTVKGETRQVIIQRISNTLLEVAKETGIPFIVGAQINREPEKRGGSNDPEEKKANMVLQPSYIRESGDIEQDASLILGIYKPDDGTKEGYLLIKVMKNRNGKVGDPKRLNWEPSRFRVW